MRTSRSRTRRRVEWDQIANKFGFASARDMLEHWYIGDMMSTTEIGKRLGITFRPVLNKLKQFGIPLRKKGGRNNSRWKQLRVSQDKLV